MTEERTQYTAKPDELTQLRTENWNLRQQLDRQIAAWNGGTDALTAHAVQQAQRIAELEAGFNAARRIIEMQLQTIARLEADKRRLRHLDSMPVDAMRRYYRGTTYAQYAAHLAQYTPQQYDEDGEAIDNWLMALDGAA